MSKINSKDTFDSKAEIKSLKDDFEPHNLSKKICEAINNQKDVDRSIKSVIDFALEKDIDTRNIVKNIAKEAIKDEWWKRWIQILIWLGSLLCAFISGGYFK
jgi:hypothetical protein